MFHSNLGGSIEPPEPPLDPPQPLQRRDLGIQKNQFELYIFLASLNESGQK